MARTACKYCGSTDRITDIPPFERLEDVQVLSKCGNCGKVLFTGGVVIVDDEQDKAGHADPSLE
jgi:uncharacterized Zn finger protein